MFKRKIILILFCGLSFSQTLSNPIFKSSVFPGWGQKELGNKKHHKIFLITEVSLLLTCFTSYGFSKHLEYKFQSYASQHAGLRSKGKDRQFWVDIGNYLNTQMHNEEHLRWREHDALYESNDLWNWDSDKSMKKFEKIRIKSDQLAINGKFIAGAILVNHIISAIDALYLKRINSISTVRVVPLIASKNSRLELLITF